MRARVAVPPGEGPSPNYFVRCPALEKDSPEGDAAMAWIDPDATGFDPETGKYVYDTKSDLKWVIGKATHPRVRSSVYLAEKPKSVKRCLPLHGCRVAFRRRDREPRGDSGDV